MSGPPQVNEVSLDNPTTPQFIKGINASRINYLAKNVQNSNNSFIPVTPILFPDFTIHALWDTGSSVTAINYDIAIAHN